MKIKIQIIIKSNSFYFGKVSIFENMSLMSDEIENQCVSNSFPNLQKKYIRFCKRMNLKYEGVNYELV